MWEKFLFFLFGYDVSVFVSNILNWPVYIVEIMLALFTIIRVFDEKKECKGIGISTKILAVFCSFFCALTFICFFTGVYNTDKIEEIGENYTYFGQMKNGTAEGNGRVFNENGTWLYSGKFINNKLNGSGKEYKVQVENKKEQAVLYYEGEYKDGDKCGEGILYYATGEKAGEIYYKGQFYDGKINGYGTLYLEDGKIYEGGFANNQKFGFGQLTWNEEGKEHILIGVYADDEYTNSGKELINGDLVSEGEYLNFSKNGWFEEYYNGDVNNIKFEGFYQNGVREGEGKEYYKNGNLMYDGEYAADEWNGSGKKYYENGGILYEGEYINGSTCGYGTVYYENGNKQYEGEWLNGNYHGEGVEYNEDGTLKSKGTYKNNYLNGHGTIYNYEKDNKSYEGNVVNGNAHGKGKSFYENGGIKYEGEYVNGRYEGKGISYDENGDIEYQGIWENGEFIG